METSAKHKLGHVDVSRLVFKTFILFRLSSLRLVSIKFVVVASISLHLTIDMISVCLILSYFKLINIVAELARIFKYHS